jgi:hypothetical protein
MNARRNLPLAGIRKSICVFLKEDVRASQRRNVSRVAAPENLRC